MNPKISIITINYNDKVGLQKTFNSVFSQTFKDFEYLVIDGKSNDGSVEFIEQNKHKINYWISEKDNGVYQALNKGIRKATGDYLIFMNGGDEFYDENVLDKIHPFLDNKIGVFYGNSAYYKNDCFVRNEIPPSKLTFDFFFNFALNHQATITKRELFEKYFYYNENYKICADWDFLMYVICAKNEPYQYLNMFICNYDLSGISANEKNKLIYESERKTSLEKFFPLFYDNYLAHQVLKDNRVKRILHIKKFSLPWKILKAFVKFLLIFLPKMEKK